MSRAGKTLVWLAAIFVLLFAGFAVAESFLRQAVPEKFAGHVREFISLSDDHPVDVELQGVLTWQYLTGGFNNVAVKVADAPLQDGLRATLSASAERMPVNPEKGEIVGANVAATFNEDQLQGVVQMLSRGVGQEVTIESDRVEISNSFTVFGQKIPLTVSFKPSAKDGALHIQPVAVAAAGVISLTVDQLPKIAGLQDFANGFDICIADKVPSGVTLKEINLSSAQQLTVTAGIDPHIGLEPALQDFGAC